MKTRGIEDPRKILEEARQNAKDGKFEAALKKHVWFHEHALKKRPSLYGVRLSFALRDWRELGKKYSKALKALKKIRDRDTALILRGENRADLFHDVASINYVLPELKHTVSLFKQIDQTRSDFATAIYHMADEALISAGEYQIARKHLGNPQKRFIISRRDFKSGLKDSAKAPKNRKKITRAYERVFTEDVLRLLMVLDKTGDHKKALEIQEKALKVLNSEAIKSAVTL